MTEIVLVATLVVIVAYLVVRAVALGREVLRWDGVGYALIERVVQDMAVQVLLVTAMFVVGMTIAYRCEFDIVGWQVAPIEVVVNWIMFAGTWFVAPIAAAWGLLGVIAYRRLPRPRRLGV